jgi:hypothetical protein
MGLETKIVQLEPRSWLISTPKAVERLVSKLKPFAGTRIVIFESVSSWAQYDEVYPLIAAIGGVLMQSHWRARDGSELRSPRDAVYFTEPVTMMTASMGMLAEVDPKASPHTKGALDALAAALNAEKLNVDAGPGLLVKHGYDKGEKIDDKLGVDTIVLNIFGRNPWNFWPEQLE